MAEALDLVSNILQTIPIIATASPPLQASMAVLRVKLQAKLGESGDVGMVAFGCKTVTVIKEVSMVTVEILGGEYLTSMHKQPKEYTSHLIFGQGSVSSPLNSSNSEFRSSRHEGRHVPHYACEGTRRHGLLLGA